MGWEYYLTGRLNLLFSWIHIRIQFKKCFRAKDQYYTNKVPGKVLYLADQTEFNCVLQDRVKCRRPLQWPVSNFWVRKRLNEMKYIHAHSSNWKIRDPLAAGKPCIYFKLDATSRSPDVDYYYTSIIYVSSFFFFLLLLTNFANDLVLPRMQSKTSVAVLQIRNF